MLRLPATVPTNGVDTEIYIQLMRHPNTGMVISGDLGDGRHPNNKSGYGQRATRAALGMVYGRPIEYYGPLYAAHQIAGANIRIRYTHVDQGLAVRPGEKLQGFAVAGAGKVFHWADAQIEGDTVVVSSPQVPQPVAVRYAWSYERRWANLYNKDGLPALTFRTDTWDN